MWRLWVIACVGMVLSGCGQSDAPSEPNASTDQPLLTPSAEETEPVLAKAPGLPEFKPVADQIERWANQHHSHLQTTCQSLFDAVQRFQTIMTTDHQQEAQQAWHRCYQAWNQGLLLQQRGLNLVDSNRLQRQRRRINVRPFQPGYIDALPDYPYSGLIHEAGLSLNLSELTEQHQMLDLESAALGFPVLETLLWQSPLDLYWLDDEEAESPANRRQQYLRMASQDLATQISLNQTAWQDTPLHLLPESLQPLWFWQSALRLVAIDIHQFALAPSATSEPLWHHPSWVAGSGRDHLLARLDSLTSLLARVPESPNPLRRWLDRARLGVTAEDLDEHLNLVREALQGLPANYPADSTDDAHLAATRVALLALTERLRQINAGLSLDR